MFRRLIDRFWRTSPSPEKELQEIFARGITRTILPSAADHEAFNKNKLATDDKVNCLLLCLCDYHQLPDITYQVTSENQQTVIDISSEHTEDHYKLIIALCRRFNFRVKSAINDPKLANDR